MFAISNVFIELISKKFNDFLLYQQALVPFPIGEEHQDVAAPISSALHKILTLSCNNLNKHKTSEKKFYCWLFVCKPHSSLTQSKETSVEAAKKKSI